MDIDAFYALVARMMAAQKRYFKTRSSADLEYSKALERQVNQAVRDRADPQPMLFGEEGGT